MSHVLSSNVNGVISSPHWEVWTMGIGAGGGGAQMQDGLHQVNPNLAELRPLAPRPCCCPGPLSSRGPFLGHRGPPAPDLCGLPGNPRGSLSAHEFRGTRGAAGSRPPTARLLLPPAASARGPGLRSSVTANCGRALRGCAARRPRARIPGLFPLCKRRPRALRLARGSVYWALVAPGGRRLPRPLAEPWAHREVNPTKGRRALCPPARRPARFISRRLQAQLANLSSPLPTLPG